MDETTLPSGKVVYAVIMNQLLGFMKDMLQNLTFLWLLMLESLDTDGEVVTELYQGVNVSELAGGRIKNP
ncbi:hypothetical protein [Escherichia coli]|uniref:hypothetical protein n=1 Tax=Escherichia coli TaxID=562 RepID=UPI002023B31A|nr:hypothetical protein [Escherichia coli]